MKIYPYFLNVMLITDRQTRTVKIHMRRKPWGRAFGSVGRSYLGPSILSPINTLNFTLV